MKRSKNKKKAARPKPEALPRAAWVESLPLQISVSVLLVLVAYWNSLDGGFHFDDQGIFLDPYIMSPGFGWKILRLTQTRPLTFLTFHWNYVAGGVSPLGFHWVNVLLHAVSTVLVLLIARRQLPGSLPLLAGALFAVHPLQTQAVNYVFERATLLAAAFALTSMLLFMRERYAWSAVAFGLSLLAKEETVALPVFLLLYDAIHRRNRIRWSYHAAMLGLASLFSARLFFVLHSIPKARLGFGTNGMSAVSYALTQCRVVWRYLGMYIFPAGLNLDHDVRVSHGLFHPPGAFLAFFALALLLAALAWLSWRKKNAPALWALGFFVLLTPSSSVIPAEDLMFEHRTYLPLVCLVIATASLWKRLWRSLGTPAAAVLLAALLMGTIERNRIWHDDQSLWADVVGKSPGKARGYFQLGQSFASQDPDRARLLYESGLKVEPENTVGHTNLGLILLSQGETGAALAHLRQALSLGGDDPLVWNNLGAAQLDLGRTEDAVESFRRALAADPCRFDARWNLIHTLFSVGRATDALLAAQIPGHCKFLPEQLHKLEEERLSLR